YFRQGNLLRKQVAVVGEAHAIAEGMPSRQATAPRGTAHRCGGVKAIERQARLGHRVQMGRLDHRTAVEACVAPAQVVRHEQDYVGAWLRAEGGEDRGE